MKNKYNIGDTLRVTKDNRGFTGDIFVVDLIDMPGTTVRYGNMDDYPEGDVFNEDCVELVKGKRYANIDLNDIEPLEEDLEIVDESCDDEDCPYCTIEYLESENSELKDLLINAQQKIIELQEKPQITTEYVIKILNDNPKILDEVIKRILKYSYR